MSSLRLGGVILLLALVLGACGGDDGLCDRLAGTDFRSEEQISAILGPEGLEPTNEFVQFSTDEAYWQYSDVVESGEWDCRGDRVSFLDGRFEADVIEEEGIIVLDRAGIRYVQD